MSFTYLNHFLVENASMNTIPVFCIMLCMVEFFLLYVLPNWVGRSYSFFSRSSSFDLSKAQDSSCSSEKVEDGSFCRADMETVMGRLGIFADPEGEKLQERLVYDGLMQVFEEKEPGLEEVKGAFDVFDENGDGFIDARELQRVLCNLGFREGLEMENCRRMIDAYDDNGDGRIDFDEFVKFMENTFC